MLQWGSSTQSEVRSLATPARGCEHGLTATQTRKKTMARNASTFQRRSKRHSSDRATHPTSPKSICPNAGRGLPQRPPAGGGQPPGCPPLGDPGASAQIWQSGGPAPIGPSWRPNRRASLPSNGKAQRREFQTPPLASSITPLLQRQPVVQRVRLPNFKQSTRSQTRSANCTRPAPTVRATG